MSGEDDAIPEPVLRDLFAAAALVGMGTWTPSRRDLTDGDAMVERAEWAYQQADMMLIARKEVWTS